MNIDTKINLITRNLSEIVGSIDAIKKIISERPLKIYFGTAPTGKIHIGYCIPIIKICDFLNAGCHVKILIADTHAILDSGKSSHENVQARVNYYIEMLSNMIIYFGGKLDNLEYVIGSSYQKSPEYFDDLLKLMTKTTIDGAKHAGSEVVKQSKDPLLSNVIYPLLQSLDEKYLDIDIEYSGIDQRKIICYSIDYLKKIGYKHKKIYLMSGLLKSLGDGDKMSSSDQNSKIDFMDSKKIITKKINKIYVTIYTIRTSILLELITLIILPTLTDKYIINRSEENGGNLFLDTNDISSKICEMVETEKLHLKDLKLSIVEYIDKIISPIRNNENLVKLISKAYK